MAASWTLDLYGKNGRKINLHGRKDTKCNTIEFRPSLNVNRANFNPATTLLPDPNSFELYTGASCNGLAYRNGKGNHKFNAKTIRSYKVLGGLKARVRREADIEERDFVDIEDIEARDADDEESEEAVETVEEDDDDEE